MEKYFCAGRDFKMNTVIGDLINELLNEASENKKQADIADAKGDIGLSGYHRGISESKQELATKITKLISTYGQTLH